MANTNSNGLAGITEERVLHDLHCYYGLSGKLKQLGSCQDINYRLTTSNHEKYVVKYLNPSISWDDINFQHQILDYLHSFRPSTTQDSSNNTPFLIPYPKKRIDDNSTVVAIKDSTTGSVYHMCVLLFIEGDLLSDFKYLHPLTLREIGRDIAKFNQLLVTFPLSDDYARQSEWDMRKSYLICEARRSAIKDIALQEKMMSIASIANDILKFHENSLRHQLIHGDLADYNIIAKKTDFDRPKIIGIIDFGDIVESWLIADLAVAIVPLLSKPNHNTMEIVTEVVRGFCSLTPLNESELNCLWHLILLRAILITINVISILEDDPNNQYLLDEKELNLQVVETVLNIPIQYAVSAIRAAGGKPTDGNSNDDLLYRHGLMLKDSSPIKVVEVDFSCQNSAFHSGNWLERGTLASIIKATINDALPSPSPVVSSPGSFLSSSPHANANQTVFEVKYGNPWLTRSVFRSFEAPQSIATFSIYFLAKGTRIYAPWNAVARVTEDIQSLNLLISDLKRSTTASSSRTRSASGGFGSFSSSAPKVLELKNDQFTMVIYGLHIASPLVNFDSTWNVKAGDKIGEVNTESIEGYYSPIVIQIFATPNEEISLYKQVLPVSSYYPPLFVTAYEYEIYRLFTFDPIFLFTGHLAKACDISGKPSPPPAPTSEVEGKEKETEDALWKREQYVSACQEYYYKQDIFPPPQIERGYQQYLYDIYGRGYLDMVNNVAVVGHSHPRIANNVYQQLLKLNTNSRFIYSALGDYAEKILSHIPLKLRQEGKLNRVFFVNSGSEATDLALRIARSVVSERRMKTKQLRKEEQLYEFCRDVICVQGGYHGVTTASDEVSTTLNDNPRSLETRAAWIHLVPMPNHYRGLHRLSSNEYNEENLRSLATEYAGLVREKIHRLKESGIVPAAFIAEPLSGNAGGVILPPTYLAQVYEMIHEIGGLCINDEVQVGYGRLGNVFWGFEEHGIVPDIITMAKAAGNGHPLGFVVTSEQIAKEFYESQGSFFSSAGGGPVSCVVGSTVLSIIEEEELQTNALEVGKYLNERLWAVQKKFPHIVGCIHGHGLYQGIEIIKPDGSIGVNNAPAPGTQEAYKICDRLLQLGVISHNTGDYSNVLKVKPPLCITREDADFFCEALEITLSGF